MFGEYLISMGVGILSTGVLVLIIALAIFILRVLRSAANAVGSGVSRGVSATAGAVTNTTTSVRYGLGDRITTFLNSLGIPEHQHATAIALAVLFFFVISPAMGELVLTALD